MKIIDTIQPMLTPAQSQNAINNRFYYSALKENLEAMQQAIEDGADIGFDNNVTLRKCAERGCAKSVDLLLKAGADISTNKYEALRLAFANNRKYTVKAILANQTTHQLKTLLAAFKEYLKNEGVKEHPMLDIPKIEATIKQRIRNALKSQPGITI